MAKNKSTVYLGYEDEEVTAKHIGILNSTVNKIGGTADWPSGEIKVPSCPLCGIARPLIVQLYAPLDESEFHRSLYVFACLNPNCSQNSKSWLCIRTQHMDSQGQNDVTSVTAQMAGGKAKKKHAKSSASSQKISWCSGADDWGEEMDTEADDFGHQNEENGNVVTAKNDNSPARPISGGGGGVGAGAPLGSSLMGSEEDDDDEDESASMENDLICGFGQLEMHSPQSKGEDPNANCGGEVAAAAVDSYLAGGVGGVGVGAAATASICAEIEGAETDVVLVETPKKPERDLIALLKHTPSSIALGPLAKITDVTLKPYFMAVDMEQRQRQAEYEHYGGVLSADHIRELYQEYKRQDEGTQSPIGGGGGDAGGVACGGAAGEDHEAYEKTLPAHGDVVFHQFLVTLQENPGQILRYSRDTLPLLIAPLMEPLPKCQNCNGETICEVQILSTLIPRLRLQQNNELAPIEYGNVLVFTCLKNCWDTPDKMRYEKVIVQAEK